MVARHRQRGPVVVRHLQRIRAHFLMYKFGLASIELRKGTRAGRALFYPLFYQIFQINLTPSVLQEHELPLLIPELPPELPLAIHARARLAFLTNNHKVNSIHHQIFEYRHCHGFLRECAAIGIKTCLSYTAQ